MILYISLKEICAFFKQKREVFLWLIFCMICISFAMNYAFSFSRFNSNRIYNFYEPRARIFEINCNEETDLGAVDDIKSELESSGFPSVKETYLFKRFEDGREIIGADYIGKNADIFLMEEAWIETDDEILASGKDNVCLIAEDSIDEINGLTVVGEKYEADGEEYVIGGVVRGFFVETAMIPMDKFKEKYASCSRVDLVFSEKLSDEQTDELYAVVQKHIEHGGIKRYKQPETAALSSYSSNVMLYAAVVLLAVVCLISMLEFWQNCNKTTYAVYWLNGASKKKLAASSVLGIIMLALGGYLIGLCLSAAAQFIFPMLTSLELTDIILGFSLYIICFIISGAVISIKNMNSIKISDIRRDV